MSASYNVCRVVNGRIVKVSDLVGRPDHPSMDVDYYAHKQGRRLRYLRRDMASAESLGRVSTRIAVRMSRRQPAA